MLWQGSPPKGAADDRAAGGLLAGAAQGLVTSGGTCLWFLDPVDERHTHLITRMRDHYLWSSPLLAGQLAVDLFDIFFMRKCLLGIKGRAEAAVRGEIG
jgi:hypothetical protein